MPFIPTRRRDGITGFRGTNSRQGRTASDPWGLYSLNCEYDQNEVRTRLGTYQISSSNTDKWQKALAWKAPGGGSYILASRLDANVELYLATPSSLPSALFTGGATFSYPAFLPWGLRIYFTFARQQNLAGDSANPARYIHDPIGTPAIYPAFHAPMGAAAGANDLLYPFGTTTTAGGNATPGEHLFLLATESVTGFITAPSPSGNVFPPGTPTVIPTSVTVGTGANRTITINVTPAVTWPTHLAFGHLMMTTAANRAAWFRAPVPVAAIPVGTNTPITFVVVDPDAIVAQGEELTGLLSRKYNPNAVTSGVAPVTGVTFPAIRNINQCGNRVAWVVSSTGTTAPNIPGVYFSEDGDPEVITDDFHFIYLAGGLDVITTVTIDGRIFLLGPDWTFTTVDTGDFPVTWPTPTPISQSIGTPHPNGVSINPYKYALVAHESGLYILRAGGYDERPISWNQREWWEKIVWPTNSSGSVPPLHVVEDTELRLVMVQCITTDYPNGCIYVWDYSEGLRWDRIKFSVWTFPGGAGAIAMPHNLGDAESSQVRQQLAIFPKATGRASLRKRANSTTPYVDSQGERIDSQYQTTYFGQRSDKIVSEFTGLNINALGHGDLRITALGLDDTPSLSLRNTNVDSVGRKYQRGTRLKSEGCSFLFRNGANAGDWFRLLASPQEPMEVYFRPFSHRKRN